MVIRLIPILSASTDFGIKEGRDVREQGQKKAHSIAATWASIALTVNSNGAIKGEILGNSVCEVV